MQIGSSSCGADQTPLLPKIWININWSRMKLPSDEISWLRLQYVCCAQWCVLCVNKKNVCKKVVRKSREVTELTHIIDICHMCTCTCTLNNLPTVEYAFYSPKVETSLHSDQWCWTLDQRMAGRSKVNLVVEMWRTLWRWRSVILVFISALTFCLSLLWFCYV